MVKGLFRAEDLNDGEMLHFPGSLVKEVTSNHVLF